MSSLTLRTLDIAFSLAGIILGLPIFIIILTLGFFDTGSPLFFQQRVGKNQKFFTLIKFRTMMLGTKSVGTHLADSASITKLGRFLRKTKLDELPQLVNVLLGQMSFVGPRPCLPNQSKLIEQRQLRNVFNVRPGITGLGQLNEVDMSTPKKLALYDQLMIKNMCLKLYLKFILDTALGHGRGDRVRIAGQK